MTEAIAEVRRLFREFQFAEAAAQAEQLLSDLACDAEAWDRAARALLRERPFFPNTQTAEASEVYFVTVLRKVEASPDASLVRIAQENLAGLWVSIGKYDEALPLRESLYRHARSVLPADDPRLMIERDNLAIVYRNLGRADGAASLYTDLGICEHLAPVLADVMSTEGVTIVSCGQAWSANCHIWAYVDCVIDCEALLAGHNKDGVLEIHAHRGTHDGSERGVVCTVHHDGVMGRYP